MRIAILVATLIAITGCSGAKSAQADGLPFLIRPVAEFNEPWAMAFLPDGRALITEQRGAIKIWREGEPTVDVKGAPRPAYGGQGGLGDVALHPEFSKNHIVYLSWVEAGQGGKGAVVGRAVLIEDTNGPRLDGLNIIWRQVPKTSGSGHFGHRIAFGADGALYISSGERQKFDPAQDPSANLGKIIRMKDDGSAAEQISLGHRNPLGIAFDAGNRLWEIEMGPMGGDEVNLIKRGANYGWPRASNGSHYGGRDIPDHSTGDGFEAPKVWWTPSISPGSLMIYSGALFPKWKGDAFIGALGGEALIRVDLSGENANKADEWPMDARIREVEQGPDGAIWLLEDGSRGRLLKLSPRSSQLAPK